MKMTSVRCVNHQWNPLSILMVLMLIASVMCISKAFAQPLDSEVPPSSSNEVVADYSEDQPWVLKDKRPFCNAFAGCGRKRNVERKRAVEALLMNYPRNADMKLWDKLFTKLQQRYRANR